jgi:hypothetical protein
MGKIALRLNAQEVAELQKAVRGAGGYQTLLRQLQPLLKRGGWLTIDDNTLGRIVRSCAYGSGGFQGRLRRAFRRSINDLLQW